jgi:hypothetical protein
MNPLSTLEVTQKDVDVAVARANKHFNAMAFKALMEKFETHVDDMVEYGKKIKVGGIETERKSIDLSTSAKRVNKEIDTARMAAKRPYLDFTQQLDGMVRPIQKRLNTIEKTEKGKCISYRNEILRKENEANAKAAKEAAEVEAMKSKIDSPLAGLSVGKPKPVMAAVAKIDSFSAGSGSYKKIMVPKLADITKVPAKYLLVDWKAVKAAQKQGVTQIDGIDFVEEMDMTLRS